MHKKNYEAIATVLKIVNDEVEEGDLDDWDAGHQTAFESITNGLIAVFELDNPNFDRKVFLKACGIFE